MDELEELREFATAARNANYAFIVALTVFFWDWALCLEKESKHFGQFWKKSRPMSALLYYGTKFLMTASLVIKLAMVYRPGDSFDVNESCRISVYFLLVFITLNTGLIQVLLSLRTYALWNCRRSVLIFLMVLNIVTTGLQIALILIYTRGVKAVLSPLPSPYTGCLFTLSPTSWSRSVPTLFFEFLVMVLMVTKFYEYGRLGRSTELSGILFRDGFVEFIVVSVSTIISLILTLPIISGANALYLLSYELAPIIAQICASHIILNIHDVMTISEHADHQSTYFRGMSGPSGMSRTAITQRTNPHAVSFQMGPMAKKRSHVAQDILDIEVDVDVDVDYDDEEHIKEDDWSPPNSISDLKKTDSITDVKT